MSRLGLPKYAYTDGERNENFDMPTNKLNTTMINMLSPNNFDIHHKSFDIIKQIVYEKRAWKE